MDKYLYFWLKIRGEYSPFDIANENYSYEDIFSMGKEDLLNKVNLKEKDIDYILGKKREFNIDSEYEKFLKSGVKVLEYGQAGFPNRLLSIQNPPRAIFYYGELPKENVKSVSIIGARKCSEYGRFMAEKLAKGLVNEGIQIISGMALGIDGLAQMAALEAGGLSYGVLGSGVDICYPRSNINLYERLKREGGIISEYANGTAAINAHFPKRNRIISGLSDGLIVVEAKQKSGTIITVDAALSQGREIFVVPGRATDALSVGCNGLIKQGAFPVQCAEDVIEVLENYSESCDFNLNNPVSNLSLDYKSVLYKDKKNVEKIMPEKIELTPEENMVYSSLGFNPLSPAELLEYADLDFISITKILVELEMRGIIKEVSRNKYVRNIL